jgi:hypothetical protein
MSATVSGPRPAGTRPRPTRDWNRTGWGIVRAAALAATAALVVTLVAWPTVALRVLWDLLIPVLPASFLVAPHLWRGVCPLATLNQWSGARPGRRQLGGRPLVAANALGVLLLVLLVPARRFAFNENGPALAATITIVAAAALALGVVFSRRAGFCNAVCPILPVERLYGQHPLWKPSNRRCDRCTVCIPKGCLDVDPFRSFAHAIGREAGRHRWLTTTYGAFAAALPGFIVGYFTLGNVPWTAAAGVYLWVALCSAGSYLAATVVVRVLGLTRPVSLALLAAAAVALYYWWAAPRIAGLLGAPPAGTVIGRAAALALVAVWLVRARPRFRTDRGKVALL